MMKKVIEFAGKITASLSTDEFKEISTDAGLVSVLTGYGFPVNELEVFNAHDFETIRAEIYNKAC